jgi:hypothetical protein
MENKSRIDWKRGDKAVIKSGWDKAGTVVEVLGSAIFLRQWWVPIKGIDHEDPDFHKEAALDYSDKFELPEKYIPDILRPSEKEKLPRKLMFGIGQLKENDGEIGMWEGPNPRILNMLDVPGRDINSVIIKFNTDGTHSLMYRWFPLENCWGKF